MSTAQQTAAREMTPAERKTWVAWLAAKSLMALYDLNKSKPFPPDILDEVVSGYNGFSAAGNLELDLYVRFGLLQPYHVVKLLELYAAHRQQLKREKQERMKRSPYAVKR